MNEFTHNINLIEDKETLDSKKEELKEKVIDSSLHWKDRMELYKQIQLINERIQLLEKTINNM